MDLKGCLFLIVLICNVICLSFAAPSSQKGLSEYTGDRKLLMLEKLLRSDIDRQLHDVIELENQMRGQMNVLTEKKRQLEIRKRDPVQCLVNVVSCWKK